MNHNSTTSASGLSATGDGATAKTALHPESWVADYGDLLYRVALFKVREPAAAEDLVQETFLAALRSGSSFQGLASEKTWLMGILKHKIQDFFRRQARESPLPDLDFLKDEFRDRFRSSGLARDCWIHHLGPKPWTSPAESFAQREFWIILRRCCDKLPVPVSRAFLLREMDGLDTSEICGILGLSKANLWVMLHRARLALRSCLEKNWFGHSDQPQ